MSSMIRFALVVAVVATATNCKKTQGIVEARTGFETVLVQKKSGSNPLRPPPAELFDLIEYSTPQGPMAAYLSKPADPSTKHPAIVWIAGGFPPGRIGSIAW